MHKIIVVEDDVNIRDLLVYALNNHGYKAYGFPGAKEFFNYFEEINPSLVILDLMLDGEDGYSILSKIRKGSKNSDVPVILLTAKDSEYDKVKGLDMGADDYITKPFGVLETVSRIKAILRRSLKNQNEDSILEFKDIYLDYRKREIYVGEELINLTYKEFELLYFFLINEEIVLSREKLMYEVWGFDYTGESRTVDVHIRTLRQKLKDSGKYIKTIRNIGYKIGE
ncbi:MAG: response regulator transcription factor [Helcococcus sp.]|nr:response regulator transcription factor [Helcococcus sp.]